jgi:hypothetical protein
MALRFWQAWLPPRLISNVEAVEKVNPARDREVGRKYDLSEYPVCDDLMLGGPRDPENHPLILLRVSCFRLVLAKLNSRQVV